MDIDSIKRRFGRTTTTESADTAASGKAVDIILNLDVSLLAPNPYQPRKQFDTIEMAELTRSIAEMGVIHPIVVRRRGEKYEIVAGERRWRAATNAGQTSIPALVRDFTDREMAEIALVENLQRADLSYFEEAEGFKTLIEDFGMTQEEVAKKIGKSQPTIANKLRVLHIDPEVREQIVVGLVSERHVRALLRLPSSTEQMLILKEIYENELTVAKTEQLIADYLEGRAVFEEMPSPDDEGEEAEIERPKRQTIRRIFSDYRIYVNTIKEAVGRIVESGVEAKMQEAENEESITVTITIPKDSKK